MAFQRGSFSTGFLVAVHSVSAVPLNKGHWQFRTLSAVCFN